MVSPDSSPRLSPHSDVISLPDDSPLSMASSLVEIDSLSGPASHSSSPPSSPSALLIHMTGTDSDPPSGPASIFSPALSSSAPSSANFENEGLSDVSSLDDHDFDFIEAELLRRPASALSARSSAGWSSHGGPPRSTAAARLSAPSASEGYPDPLALLSPHPERPSKTEADALSSSLGSTYGFFRVQSSADVDDGQDLDVMSQHLPRAGSQGEPSPLATDGAAPTPRESQSWAVGGSTMTSASTMLGSRVSRSTPRQSGLLVRALETAGGTVATDSRFEFPDPMSESFRTSVAEEKKSNASPALSASDAFSILTGSDVHPPGESGLRNPWRAPASTRSKGTQHSSVAPQSSASVMDSELTSSRVEEMRRRGASEPPPSSDHVQMEDEEKASKDGSSLNETMGEHARGYPPRDSSSHLNLFFLGRKMHPHLVARLSNVVRQSLLRHFEGDESDGTQTTFETVRREQPLRAIAVTESQACLSGGRTILLREYDSTVPIGSSPDATLSLTTWLRTVGQREVRRGGALVVCLLESGEQPPLDLVLTLSALLKRRGLSLDLPQHQPIVLPVLCPRAPSNLDDGDSSLEIGGEKADVSGDLAKELTRSFHLRSMERQWRQMLLSAECTLTESMKLRSTGGSGSGQVVSFDGLVRDAPACFGGDARWAAPAATEVRRAPSARTVAGVGAPLWLVRTAAWLKAHKPVDLEQQYASYGATGGAINLVATGIGSEAPVDVSSAAAAMAAALDGGLEGVKPLHRPHPARARASHLGRSLLNKRESILAGLVVLLSTLVGLLSYNGNVNPVRLATDTYVPRHGNGRSMTTPAPVVPPTLSAPSVHGFDPLVPSRHAPVAHTAPAPTMPGFILKGEGQLAAMGASGGRAQRALSRRLRSAAEKSLSVIPNRTSDLAIYHFIDANSLASAQEWLTVPLSTAMAVGVMRKQPEALDRFLAASQQLGVWVAETALAVAQETIDELAFWAEEIGDFVVNVVAPPIGEAGLELYVMSCEAVHTVDVATAPARKVAAEKSVEMARAAQEAVKRLDEALDGATHRRRAYEQGAKLTKQASEASQRMEKELERKAQEARRALTKARRRAARDTALWMKATRKATAKVLKMARSKNGKQGARARRMSDAIARDAAVVQKAAIKGLSQGAKLAEDAGRRAEDATKLLAQKAEGAKKAVRESAGRASERIKEAVRRTERRRKERKEAWARKRGEKSGGKRVR